MSGSNGVNRYAKVNREDELVPLKYRGPEFHALDSTKLVTLPGPPAVPNPTALTPAQMFMDLRFDATTVGPIIPPTFASTVAYLSTNGLLTPGYSWTVLFENTNNVTDYGINSIGLKITYPTDWSIGGTVNNTLTIGPNNAVEVTYVVDSVPLFPLPPTIRVYTHFPWAAGGRAPYWADHPVQFRPSNADSTFITHSVIDDFTKIAGQHISIIISEPAVFAQTLASLPNCMQYLKCRSTVSPTVASHFFVGYSNGLVPDTTYNFAVKMDGTAIAPAFVVTSAAAGKADIVDLPVVLADVYQLRPRQYRYAWEAVGTKRWGFVADEVLELASMGPAATEESVDIYALCAAQSAAINDLNARLVALNSKLNSTIAALKAAPNSLVLP